MTGQRDGHKPGCFDPTCPGEPHCFSRTAKQKMSDQGYPFIDPISGREVVLWMGDENSQPYDGTHGVEHPDCDQLADVSPDLDCFFCRKCHWNGRISGAWFMDLWRTRHA